LIVVSSFATLEPAIYFLCLFNCFVQYLTSCPNFLFGDLWLLPSTPTPAQALAAPTFHDLSALEAVELNMAELARGCGQQRVSLSL
jgi:hypothetical protein